MKLTGKKILLTGGGGFIGSHLTERLVRSGARVAVFLRYNSRLDEGFLRLLPSDTRKNINVVWGDLRGIQSVKRAVRDKEVIFHLGALISVPYSYVNPQDVIETNILGTVHILEAAREYGVEKIVHTSSSEVYGTALYTPIDERHPLQAQSPYSASKIGADKICESYFKSFDVPVAIVRPFNTYGPRQSARAVIPSIISQVVRSNTVRIGALSPVRDFTFVSDTVNGFLEIAQHKETVGKTLNLGNGIGISIRELTATIGKLMGKQINVEHEEARIRPPKSEVQKLIADTKETRSLLSWQPEVSLDRGLATTIKWVEEHPDLFKPETYNI